MTLSNSKRVEMPFKKKMIVIWRRPSSMPSFTGKSYICYVSLFEGHIIYMSHGWFLEAISVCSNMGLLVMNKHYMFLFISFEMNGDFVWHEWRKSIKAGLLFPLHLVVYFKLNLKVNARVV